MSSDSSAQRASYVWSDAGSGMLQEAAEYYSITTWEAKYVRVFNDT